MDNLEHIKLLQTRISRAAQYVSNITEENAQLKKQNEELQDAITTLKEEKARVEEGIISAMAKLNQFEEAIEKSLGTVKTEPSVERSSIEPSVEPSGIEPSSEPPSIELPSAYTVEEDDEEPIDDNDETAAEVEPINEPETHDEQSVYEPITDDPLTDEPLTDEPLTDETREESPETQEETYNEESESDEAELDLF